MDCIRPDKQTVMFSATFPRQMEALARKILDKPIEVMCLLRYGKTGTFNLTCNIAAKCVEQRYCAFYHPHQICLATNQVVNRFERGW